MYQLIVSCLSFLTIPILIKKKIKLSYTILIASLILGILSGIGFTSFMNAVANAFIKPSNQRTVMVVAMVSVLGGVMKHYGVLEGIVDSMQKVVGSKKNIIMLIPSLIGMLIIPGGALLSAPFVNRIGEEINMPSPRRAAINLVFRHLSMLLLPFSTSILIISAVLPDISIPFVISLNFIFVICMIILGYVLFLRDVGTYKEVVKERTFSNIKKLVIYTSPIFSCVIITAITGIPFYISMFASLFIVYLIGNKKDFLPVAIKAIDFKVVLTVVSILIMQSIIMEMKDMLGLFNDFFNQSNNIFAIGVVILVASTFFGYITGYSVASLAITLPLIAQLNVTNEMLHVYTYLAAWCAFIGYFFSPLHLCQAFTTQLMGVSTGELYKEYRIFAPALLSILIVTVVIFNFIFGG
jgi:hypothetical protein